MVKAVKNHIRHVIAYTLNMEEPPILSYNVSEVKS